MTGGRKTPALGAGTPPGEQSMIGQEQGARTGGRPAQRSESTRDGGARGGRGPRGVPEVGGGNPCRDPCDNVRVECWWRTAHRPAPDPRIEAPRPTNA